MPASTRRTWRLAIVIASMALVPAAPLCAQQIAGSFDELQTLIKPGQSISVTDSTGTTSTGTVLRLSGASLELRRQHNPSAPPLTFSESHVNNIVTTRADPLWNGMLVGFAAG